MKNNIPEPGDVIYIDSSFHIDSTFRDVVGGKARVVSVRKQNDSYWITIEGAPQSSYNWSFLEDRQDSLKDEFRDRWSGKPQIE